jgi:hypothetical protein
MEKMDFPDGITHITRRNMNKTLLTTGLALVLTLTAAPYRAGAQENAALIDALVKKGVLTTQEGDDISADLSKEYKTTGGGKLDIASHVTKLKLYGDARFRYQATSTYGYNTVAPSIISTGTNTTQGSNRDQMRYRVRIGADYQFTDDFKAGIRLESSNANDSTNVTYADGFFKDGNQVYFGLYYLQWDPSYSWIPQDLDVTLTGGKMKPTFVIDEMNWDSDINPTGVAESFAYTGVEGFTFGANMGQYIYKDTTDVGTVSSPTLNDTWMLVNQAVAKYEWEKSQYVQIAPMLENMVNPNGATSRLAFPSGAPTVTPGAPGVAVPVVTPAGGNFYDYYTVMYLPTEVAWQSWKLPFKAYYTYGHNFDGYKTADALGVSSTGDQSDSHVLGLQVGDTKKKGGWLLNGGYVYREAYAVNPNLVDSDWGAQSGNQRGFFIKAQYAFTDFLVGGVNYLYSDPIHDQGIPVTSGLNTTVSQNQTLQVDLAFRF